MSRSIRVLYVGDTDSVERVHALFEPSEPTFSVETATSAEAALAALDRSSFDGIVSEYDLPDDDGIALLETVRAREGDLPFVLYTDVGSETVASDAISAGVSDYVPKSDDLGANDGLANRVEDVVEGTEATDTGVYLQGSTDIITVLDEDGTIEYVSPSIERVLGYDPASLVGEDGFERIHPDDVDGVTTAFSEILDEPRGHTAIECRFRTAEGEWCWIEINGRNYLDHPEIGGIVANSRNISDRKQQRRRLETLISNLPGVVYRSRNDREWTMLSVEGECEQLTGYETEALENGTVVWGDDILHPDDRAAIWHEVQAGLDTDGTFEVTYRIETADDRIKWVWERGRLVDVETVDDPVLEGFITDITDRKRDQQELEATNALLSTLFEALPVGVLAEDASRTVLAVNDRMEELFETQDRDAPFEGADCERFAREISDMFADPESFVEQTNEIVEQSASVHANELSLRDGRTYARSHEPIDLPTAAGHLWLYRDITTRKRRERELERQNERLDEFASVVSHDLRNPLQVLRGSFDAVAPDDQHQHHLARGYQALDRMETLIDDLLSLARMGQSIQTIESVSLASTANDCWAVVQTEDAELVVDGDRSLAANPERLQQLLENLIRNAVEHGGDDVTVTIGARDDRFYVEDTGPGIDPDERDQIFEPGHSMSESGTGFGLAIVQQVADAHDWTVQITEGSSGGARFEIVGVEYAD